MLKKFSTETFLDIHLKRLNKIKSIDGVICAIAKEKGNEKIIEIAKKNKCLIFIGSTKNVLNRILKAGLKFKADILLRVTSDCPLIDPQVCERIIQKIIKGKYDYVSNNLSPSFPHGLDCEAFKLKCLIDTKKEFIKTKDKNIKEHVTFGIKKNPKYKKYNLNSNISLSRYERWTLDNKIDLKFFRKLSKYIDKKDIINLNWLDILKIINSNKELQNINNTTHHFWFE